VRLTTAILKRFSVNRKAKYRALKGLEDAGLVRVRREPRRNPVVTILLPDTGLDAGDGNHDVTGSGQTGEENAP
jgi:DNA-binding transcriptional ArsR family regulator